MKFNFEHFDNKTGIGAQVEDGHGQIISLPALQTFSRLPGECEMAVVGNGQVVCRETKPGKINVTFQGGELTLEDASQMKWSL